MSLEDILTSKRREIVELRADDAPATTLRRSTSDVVGLLRRGPGEPLRILAEIKFKSPSAGPLSRALDAGARAAAYARAGASMVSVLCDGPFFGGGWGDLTLARARLDGLPRDVPLLAKEFVLDEVQLDRARAAGADAVLLIARIVSPERLAELHRAARQRDLRPLVEVVNEEEVAAAVAAGAKIIGVNARDLDTLAMDAERAARVLAKIPPRCIKIHLSGIRDPKGVRAVAASGVDAALIGETLMRQDDPEPLLRSLVDAAHA